MNKTHDEDRELSRLIFAIRALTDCATSVKLRYTTRCPDSLAELVATMAVELAMCREPGKGMRCTGADFFLGANLVDLLGLATKTIRTVHALQMQTCAIAYSRWAVEQSLLKLKAEALDKRLRPKRRVSDDAVVKQSASPSGCKKDAGATQAASASGDGNKGNGFVVVCGFKFELATPSAMQRGGCEALLKSITLNSHNLLAEFQIYITKIQNLKNIKKLFQRRPQI